MCCLRNVFAHLARATIAGVTSAMLYLNFLRGKRAEQGNCRPISTRLPLEGPWSLLAPSPLHHLQETWASWKADHPTSMGIAIDIRSGSALVVSTWRAQLASVLMEFRLYEGPALSVLNLRSYLPTLVQVISAPMKVGYAVGDWARPNCEKGPSITGIMLVR